MKRVWIYLAWICILWTPCAANLSAAEEKATVYVIFWFDTEDFILPQADDAAMRLAEMFAQRNRQATFKIVGEKARVLEERGRDDVIASLSKNDIAYHSTFHSIHPTPSEYTRDLSWAEGVSEFARREGMGLEILKRVFGVNASCYGQPGGSWTPQSYAALREFQIPVYLDVTSHVNLDNRPFWYGGMLNVLELGDCVMRTGWTDDDVKTACEKFSRISRRLAEEGGGLISIFYHPCEFIHEEFWDGVNFSHGNNPPRDQWKLPPMKSAEEQERAFQAFETYLDYIIDVPGVRIVTAREIASLYPDRVYTRPLSHDDLRTIAKTFQSRLSFVDLGERIVSTAEGLTALSSFVSQIDLKNVPESVEAVFAYGPASAPEQVISKGEFSWDAIRDAAKDLTGFIRKNEQLPSVVWINGQPVRLEDFAVTLADVVSSGRYSGTVLLRQSELEAKKYVANDNDPGLWGWVIFPQGFHAPRMMELAKLQAWTIKPAMLRK